MSRLSLRRLFGFEARQAKRQQRRTSFRPRMESLEDRAVPSVASTFVNDNWDFFNDADGSNSLTVGDFVRNSNDSAYPGTTIIARYGLIAFGTVTTGTYTGTVAGAATINDAIANTNTDGTVNVLEGTYSEQVNITQSVSLTGSVDGSNNPITSLTVNAPGGGNLVAIQGAAFAGSKQVTISNIAFQGNGANNVDNGIDVNSTSRFDKLTVENSSFTNFDINGVAVFGDPLNAGISVKDVVLTDLTFTNNGYQNIGGAGDIDIFTYNGDASLTNLTLSHSGTFASGGGIQFRGVGSNTITGADILPAGVVSLNNVDVSGTYPNYFVTFQRFSNVSNLSFNDVKLGGATSEITGGALSFGAQLRFDAVGTGTPGSPATVDLGNTYFRGLANTSTVPFTLEFAPDNGFAFLRADATHTRWNTTTPNTNVATGSLTPTELFEVEDSILHYPDFLANGEPFKGFAEVRANNAYVTALLTGSSIQRAVDVVGSPGTVNIRSGGYAGNVDATAAGRAITLAPGSSPGVVTINGNLVLNNNDALAAELNGSTAGIGYDQVIVNGTVTLGEAALAATGTRTANDGDVLVLIKNNSTDAVSGTFAGLPEGATVTAGGVTYLVTYKYNAESTTFGNGNDVALIDISNSTTPPPAGTAVLVTDPCDPSKTALAVAGTANDDNIDIKLKGKDQIEVTIDPKGSAKVTQTFSRSAVTGHILVYGLNGDDHITVQDKLTQDAWLFGGAGDDNLQAGNGDSILEGGAGDDQLQAGKGRDILIGGIGRDHLQGKNGENILIGGTTDYDNDFAALCHISDVWSDGGDFNARMAALSNSGATYHLTTGAGGTVHGDTDKDDYDGGGQTMNWIFIDGADGKVNAHKNDIVVTV
jgi:hypothetical protein